MVWQNRVRHSWGRKLLSAFSKHHKEISKRNPAESDILYTHTYQPLLFCIIYKLRVHSVLSCSSLMEIQQHQSQHLPRDLGFLGVDLTWKDQGEDRAENLSLYHMLCHQVPQYIFFLFI